MDSGLHFATAKDLFEAFATAKEDILARPGEESSLQFFAALSKSPTPEEAITFGAYLLPRRRSVWWAHECVRSVIHLLSDQDLKMLQIAESWVREPEEEHRMRAMDEGLNARTKTPGVWVALAAGWSGGSMAPPAAPKVAPPAYLTARAVNAGILGALARVDIPHRSGTLQAFVEMGIGLAGR